MQYVEKRWRITICEEEVEYVKKRWRIAICEEEVEDNNL